jgi:transposase-like protein
MEEAWLRSQLDSGRSIESIAREVGRSPSTVAYWVNKYGLLSTHAARHAARGAIDRSLLQSLVERGMSVRQIAATADRSPATVRHWLRTYGMKTRPARYSLRDEPKPSSLLRECSVHGWVVHARIGAAGRYRCSRCNGEAVSARRRRIKEILVAEAGGRCEVCGYSRYIGALQFHHLDPDEKSFSLSERGLARSLDRARAEVEKCALLCANCHAEVGAGLATIAGSRPADNAA